jgi:hypothetical protein
LLFIEGSRGEASVLPEHFKRYDACLTHQKNRKTYEYTIEDWHLSNHSHSEECIIKQAECAEYAPGAITAMVENILCMPNLEEQNE